MIKLRTWILSCQCPYKHSQPQAIIEPEEEDAAPPGLEPEAHFIQTTFIHRDKSGNFGDFFKWYTESNCLDDDIKFTQIVIDLINNLRQRLKVQAKVTIDNENVGAFTTESKICMHF